MGEVLPALLRLSAHDYSWLAQFFSLLFLPFAHEDLAVILGAYVVVNDIMPVGLVALCIYAGMVAIGFLRRQVFKFHEDAGVRPAKLACRDPRKAAATNRVPLGLFYLPLIASWISFAAKYRSLTLPIIANPRHSRGAIWGESKSAYLLDVTGPEQQHVAQSVVVIRSAGRRTLFADLERARQLVCGAGLAFPLVAKPELGRHGAARLDS